MNKYFVLVVGALSLGFFFFGCLNQGGGVETGAGDRPWCPKHLTSDKFSSSGTTGKVMVVGGIEYCQEIDDSRGGPLSEHWFSQNGSYEITYFHIPGRDYKFYCTKYAGGVTGYGGVYFGCELNYSKENGCVVKKDNSASNLCPVKCDLNFTRLKGAQECDSLPLLCAVSDPGLLSDFITRLPNPTKDCLVESDVQLYQSECYAFFGKKNRDVSLCERVEESAKYYYPNTRENCYAEIAKSALNMSLCNKTGSLQRECYQFFAQQGNSSVCELADNEYERAECYLLNAKKTENVSECEKILNPYFRERDDCYWFFANRRGFADKEICYKMTDGFTAGACQDEYFIQLAKSTKNPGYCERIDAANYKRECLEAAK